MGQIIIYKCDCCEDKIDGEPSFTVAWVDYLSGFVPVPIPVWKIFCSFNCLANFVSSEHQRRIEAEKKK